MYLLYSQSVFTHEVHFLATFDSEIKARSYRKMLDTAPDIMAYHITKLPDLHVEGEYSILLPD